MRHALPLPMLIAVLLLGAAACNADENDEPLPGAYRSTEFRLQAADGVVTDVGADGGFIEMTLGDAGTVEDGRLVVPDEVCEMLTREDCEGSGTVTVDLLGEYARDGGDALTFDLDGSDTFIEDVRWIYDSKNGAIRAASIIHDHQVSDYVVFLEKQDDDK